MMNIINISQTMFAVTADEYSTAKLFGTRVPADTSVAEVMRQLEEVQAEKHPEASCKDWISDCCKDQCSCCRSTVGDQNTIEVDYHQEELNFDSPELTSCSRSTIKLSADAGQLSPQFSSRTSQSGKKESQRRAKDPFKVIRQSVPLLSLPADLNCQEKPSSNKNQPTPEGPARSATVCCAGCRGGKKLVVETPLQGSQPRCCSCVASKESGAFDQNITKPLANWPSFVQHRVNPYFYNEGKSLSTFKNLPADNYDATHASLLHKFEENRRLYEAALQEITSKSQASRPLAEKIAKLRAVDDLLNNMLDSRGQLEDLELDKARADHFNGLEKPADSDLDSFEPFEDCDPFLGKRRVDEDFELSHLFSWSS